MYDNKPVYPGAQKSYFADAGLLASGVLATIGAVKIAESIAGGGRQGL